MSDRSRSRSSGFQIERLLEQRVLASAGRERAAAQDEAPREVGLFVGRERGCREGSSGSVEATPATSLPAWSATVAHPELLHRLGRAIGVRRDAGCADLVVLALDPVGTPIDGRSFYA